MPTYTMPTVSLNGSPASDLLQQQLKVLRAIDALENALSEAVPNGRDYQYAPETYATARDEHAAAWASLRQIKDRAHALAYHLAEER